MASRITNKAVSFMITLASSWMMESEEDMMGMFRNYLMERIVIYSPEQLAFQIQNDLDLWSELPQGIKNLVHNLGQNKTGREVFDKYYARVTTEQLLRWLLEPWVPPGRDEQGRKVQPKYMEDDGQDMYSKRAALGSIILNWPDGKGVVWLDKNRDALGDQFKVAMGP